MEHREERIVLETSHHRITGTLQLPRDGYRSRLSDYLNAGERSFIALTDVQIVPLNGGEVQQQAFVALAVSQIVLAMPAGDT